MFLLRAWNLEAIYCSTYFQTSLTYLAFCVSFLGEYKYKSDRSRLYSPNLANLPQRMFKFCFGIKAEGSAVLRVGPEDYDEGGYPLIICTLTMFQYINSLCIKCCCIAVQRYMIGIGDWALLVRVEQEEG